MTPQELQRELAAIVFAEADKQHEKFFEQSATAYANLLKNRMNNTKRYPTFDDVREGFASSEYKSKEYEKFISGNLTEDEQKFAKKIYQIVGGVIRGAIPDNTFGADHVSDPTIDTDKSWSSKTDEKSVPTWHYYYPVTLEIGTQRFHKETMRYPQQRKRMMKYQKALKEKGYYTGEIDGLNGPLTKQAVIQFQKDNNLVPDGIIGRKTRGVLFPKKK